MITVLLLLFRFDEFMVPKLWLTRTVTKKGGEVS
jgi:hypothetical protein